MKFLSLLILLAIHAYTALARYDVYFNSNFLMYIEGYHEIKARDCRFNSSKVVYCEVVIPPCYKCYQSKYDFKLCKKNCTNDKSQTSVGYRLRFDLTLKNYTEKCRESFKSTSHFNKVQLMDERGTYEELIDLSYDCMKFKLPSTFYPSKKHFKFTTKNNCVFYGYITKVTATKI
ncbi:hypothetical protein PIROE2DRAFT_7860 [Piromyces sp. E2]|nr:hypothetical protein PIROE2DRAFT_7860 [Piromyces sp. E2]|eukprot:OUM65144.1 hypothetical protein PIROE2DRAFT_7860 [Piromyces sp. E2]